MAEGSRDPQLGDINESSTSVIGKTEKAPTSIADKISFFEGKSLLGSEIWRRYITKNHAALREKITFEVGENGQELKIGDCTVTFDRGTFTDVQYVTITAEIEPKNWPPGRQAITPMLHVDAHNLLRDAAVKLHTWCAYDGPQQTVEVMRYDERNKQWELVQFCSVSESRYIEFSVKHFSAIIAVVEKNNSASYVLRPIVYCANTTFVLVLLRDTELQMHKFQQEMKTLFTSGYNEVRIQAIECKNDDDIKASILCIKPARGFWFLPDSMYSHSVRYIVTNSRPSYRICDLTSDKPSQTITIEVQLNKESKSLSRDCFSFRWNPNKGDDPYQQRYDRNDGKTVINVHGPAYIADRDVITGNAIGTLNEGEIHNENHGCTTRVTGKEETTPDSIISVEMTQERHGGMEDMKTPVQETRITSIEKLESMVENGTIRTFQTIKLLSECGDETIRNIARKVQRIVIADLPYLQQKDRILLASMIKILSPFREVNFDQFNLEPSLIPLVKGFLSSVDVFKVEKMVIEDNNLTYENLVGYFDILRQCLNSHIALYDCHLTNQNLKMITQVSQSLRIQLQKITIIDHTMPPDAYFDVAPVLKVTKCTDLQFLNCDLSKEKLQSFEMSCKKSIMSLSRLIIMDMNMSAEDYRELAVTLKSVSCKEIQFEDCNLTKRKLTELYTGCLVSDLSLSRLIIKDIKMSAEDYRELAVTLKSISCKKIQFEHCNLTKRKLTEFYTGCRVSDLLLQKMTIIDRTMPSEAYSDVATVVKVTKCTTVEFSTCDLSKEKLECFGITCKKIQASIADLRIWNDSAPADAYQELSTVLHVTGCKTVAFNNCNLTKNKMEAFRSGCEENRVSISKLLISWSQSTATEDEVSALCDLMTFTVERLDLFRWQIDAKATRRLKDTLDLESSKVRFLQLPNGNVIAR